MLVYLPDEVWTEKTKNLSIEEVYSFKFLCKRFYKIALLHKKIRYFTVISHKMFDVNDYYNTFFLMVKNLLIDDLTFLFLKYTFDRLKNLFMISNCLFHLFSCPRSDYAKNNCICCSRLYIDASICPLNLEKFEKFFLDYVSNNLKIFLKENSYNKIKFNVFFDSIEQYNAINSHKKRCLNRYVVNNL